jgi:uncharacterized membrane protein YbhN (UPF0104 family)
LRRRAGAWARLLAAALIFAVLIWRLGTRPFLDGLRGVGPGTLLAALAITGVTSVCSAWRWRVVAEALGVGLALPAATVAYYRSQFLNCTLPGGLLGDIHRGVRHGADAGSLGRGVRAVVWERTAGQVVQAAIALVVLLALPSPVHAAAPVAVAATAFAAVVVLILSRGLARHGPGRLARRVGAIVAEVRGALLQPPVWPAVMLASLLVLGGHIGMFLLAARAAGVRGTPTEMLPLALIVLLGRGHPRQRRRMGSTRRRGRLGVRGRGFRRGPRNGRSDRLRRHDPGRDAPRRRGAAGRLAAAAAHLLRGHHPGARDGGRAQIERPIPSAPPHVRTRSAGSAQTA